MCIRDSNHDYQLPINYAEEENACHGFLYKQEFEVISKNISTQFAEVELSYSCLLYTSDAADERSSVDLGGRRIIKKKNRVETSDRRAI